MTTPSPTAHRHPWRVNYRMTDRMDVVYYGYYFELFEVGRTELLRASGLTYRQMEDEGFLLPVTHAAADYHEPARYDDALEIVTSLKRLTRVRIDFDYAIARAADGAVLCTGVTRHAVVGPEGRPRRLSPQWQSRLEAWRAG